MAHLAEIGGAERSDQGQERLIPVHDALVPLKLALEYVLRKSGIPPSDHPLNAYDVSGGSKGDSRVGEEGLWPSLPDLRGGVEFFAYLSF